MLRCDNNGQSMRHAENADSLGSLNHPSEKTGGGAGSSQRWLFGRSPSACRGLKGLDLRLKHRNTCQRPFEKF